MAGTKLFILQEELSRWMDAMDVGVKSDTISLPEARGPFGLEPAVLFTRLVAGEQDTAKLLGTVKPISALAGAGLEYFQNSVIAGELAYETKEGYLISVMEGASAGDVAAGETEAPPKPGKPAEGEEPTEEDIPIDISTTHEAPEQLLKEEAPAPVPTPSKGKPAEKASSPEDLLAQLILEKLK
jgi:hypothetical protein